MYMLFCCFKLFLIGCIGLNNTQMYYYLGLQTVLFIEVSLFQRDTLEGFHISAFALTMCTITYLLLFGLLLSLVLLHQFIVWPHPPSVFRLVEAAARTGDTTNLRRQRWEQYVKCGCGINRGRGALSVRLSWDWCEQHKRRAHNTTRSCTYMTV